MSWFEEQLETRKRLDDEQVADAYERIARSVAGGKRAPHMTLDEAAATDSAVAAVLRYFGKTPSAIPSSLTDATERMDYAVRSCNMMKRKVVLEGRWWTDATGAYLGQLKSGEPIAIIPLGIRSYGYVEPLTNKKVLLTSRTAADVLPEAYCFYRPLPEESLSVRDLVDFMVASLDPGDYIRIAFATLASLYALYKQGQGFAMPEVLAIVLAFFGGELLLLCLKTILKKEDTDDEDPAQ